MKNKTKQNRKQTNKTCKHTKHKTTLTQKQESKTNK